MAVHPVILCGGAGTRLWPASREATPKQFIPLIGPRSSFQETVARVAGLTDSARPIVVAGLRHRQQVLDQLAELGAEATLLLEPEPRDSAPAMAAAVAWIARRDPEGVAVLLAADHHIPDAAAFREAIDRAVAAARQGWIVTLGVPPTAPTTAYGYIRVGDPLTGLPGVHAVGAFVEKPDAATAAAYLERGYLWNSGNFIVAAQTLLAELDRHAPAIAGAARAAGEQAAELQPGAFQLGAPFRTAPRISIDYAVMERTDRAAVAPVAFAWSDLGMWDAIWAASPKDADGNASLGAAYLANTRRSLVRAAEGISVAAIGVANLAIVVERDAVLVCGLDSSQGVRAAAAAMAELQAAPPALSLKQMAQTYAAWLSHSALPLWWALGADHQRGGFHAALSLDGAAPAGDEPSRARVLARQAHVYASAGAMAWPGPWRAAVQHAWTALDTLHLRPDGLYRALADRDGAPLADTAYLDDQACVALALASRHGQDPEGGHAAKAGALLAAIRAGFSHTRGFHEAGDQPYRSTPLLHLLEAALAWAEATEGQTQAGEPWPALAAEIATLALERLIDPNAGFIREAYGADWRPAPGAGPGSHLVEPGHQFAWADAMRRWADHTGDPRAADAARRLFRAGAKGLDPARDAPARDAVIDALDDTLSPTRATARLWPQAERLKAAAGFALAAAPAERPAWLAEAQSAARGLWRYLDVSPPGLWRDTQDATGAFAPTPAPAVSLHHLLSAIRALQALAAVV